MQDKQDGFSEKSRKSQKLSEQGKGKRSFSPCSDPNTTGHSMQSSKQNTDFDPNIMGHNKKNSGFNPNTKGHNKITRIFDPNIMGHTRKNQSFPAILTPISWDIAEKNSVFDPNTVGHTEKAPDSDPNTVGHNEGKRRKKP